MKEGKILNLVPKARSYFFPPYFHIVLFSSNQITRIQLISRTQSSRPRHPNCGLSLPFPPQTPARPPCLLYTTRTLSTSAKANHLRPSRPVRLERLIEATPPVPSFPNSQIYLAYHTIGTTEFRSCNSIMSQYRLE